MNNELSASLLQFRGREYKNGYKIYIPDFSDICFDVFPYNYMFNNYYNDSRISTNCDHEIELYHDALNSDHFQKFSSIDSFYSIAQILCNQNITLKDIISICMVHSTLYKTHHSEYESYQSSYKFIDIIVLDNSALMTYLISRDLRVWIDVNDLSRIIIVDDDYPLHSVFNSIIDKKQKLCIDTIKSKYNYMILNVNDFISHSFDPDIKFESEKIKFLILMMLLFGTDDKNIPSKFKTFYNKISPINYRYRTRIDEFKPILNSIEYGKGSEIPVSANYIKKYS